MKTPDRLTRSLVALIVLATVAFAIGAAIEKSQHHSEAASAASARDRDTILVDGRRALLVSETAAEHTAEGGGETTGTTSESAGGSEGSAANESGGTEKKSRAKESRTGGESPAAPRAESGGESATQHAAEGGGAETAAQQAGEANGEKLLGLDPEATALVVLIRRSDI
jgi:hypothetical protein